MPIFAAVFALADSDRCGREVEPAAAESLDEVADLMREAATTCGPGAAEGTLVLVVEAEDEWFGLVRVDDQEDPRAFLSDTRVVPTSPIAALLAQDSEVSDPEEGESTSQKPAVRPGGEPELLADLGMESAELLALASGEGVLPADALAAVAERVGFAESLDMLRV